MPLWDTIKGSIKGTTKNIQDSIKEKRKLKQSKEEILEKFEISQMKQICKEYIGKEPEPYEISPITGEKRRRDLTRRVYVNFIESRVSLDVLKNYAEKFRITIYKEVENHSPNSKNGFNQSSTRGPLKYITKQSKPVQANDYLPKLEENYTRLKEILDYIKNEFDNYRYKIRDERELESMIEIYLKTRYKFTQRQYPIGSDRIDILVDGKYAIELKKATSIERLRGLVNQVEDYQKHFENKGAVGAIIWDSGKMRASDIESKRQELIAKGSYAVIIHAKS